MRPVYWYYCTTVRSQQDLRSADQRKISRISNLRGTRTSHHEMRDAPSPMTSTFLCRPHDLTLLFPLAVGADVLLQLYKALPRHPNRTTIPLPGVSGTFPPETTSHIQILEHPCWFHLHSESGIYPTATVLLRPASYRCAKVPTLLHHLPLASSSDILVTIKRASVVARTPGSMAPESTTRFGRVYSRHDRGTDAWSSSGVVRLLAGCALCVAGVIAIVPRAGGEGSRGLSEGPARSGVFLNVRVPAETVPVSIGKVIGAAPGTGSNSKLDAQVTYF